MIQALSLPIDREYPFAEYTFSDEEVLSAAEKWQILQDWQRFMLSGFKKLFFTRALYRLLSQWKFTAQYNQERFWHYYFNAEVTHLKDFLAELLNANPQLSPAGSAADLKAAIRQETGRLYAPMNQVLQDLEYKHEEMVAAWHEFALNAGIQDAALPPSYIVSENTRNLLAYAAYIALKQQRPLTGLQMMFPFHQQPLLQPVPVEAVNEG